MDKKERLMLEFVESCRVGDLIKVKNYLSNVKTKPYIEINGVDLKNNNPLSVACYYGHLNVVQYLLSSPNLLEHSDIHYNNDEALRHCIPLKQFSVIEYLLTSPDLKEHANIHANNDEIFILAAKKGYLKIIKFLLTNPLLKEPVNLEKVYSRSLKIASEKGKLSVLKYLFSKKTTVQVNINNLILNTSFFDVQDWLKQYQIKMELAQLKNKKNEILKKNIKKAIL